MKNKRSNEISKKITRLLELGWTQEDIANSVGITQTMVSYLRREKFNTSYHIAREILALKEVRIQRKKTGRPLKKS